MSSFAYWQDFLTQSLEGWIETTMGEVFNHRQEKNRSELPLLSVTGSGGVVDRDSLDRRDTSNADKSKYLRVAEGDVVYNTMRMWQGVSGSAPKDGLVSPAYTVLAPTPEIDPLFAKYLVKEERLIQVFHQNSQGMVDDTLNLKYANLSPIRIKIPPLPEQKKIASILTSVDEVIENTQKQIDKLQDLKKATMNELLTKGIGHTEFKDSELGRIPKSWEVCPLGRVSKVGSSKRVMQSDYVETGVPFYRSKEIILKSKGEVVESMLYISEEQFSKFQSKFGAPAAGDILISAVGTIGLCYLVQNERFYFKDGNLLWLRNLKHVMPSFCAIYLADENTRNRLVEISGGSSQSALTIDKLTDFLMPVPPAPEQETICRIMDSLNDQLAAVRRKLLKVQALKKSLMQDLLTGNVRVSVD